MEFNKTLLSQVLSEFEVEDIQVSYLEHLDIWLVGYKTNHIGLTITTNDEVVSHIPLEKIADLFLDDILEISSIIIKDMKPYKERSE